MKKLVYIFVPLILLSSLFPTLNYSAPAGELQVVLESPEASEYDLVQSRAIIANRLEAYGIMDFKIAVQLDRRQLHITLPDAAAHEPILPLLVARGELRFSATYTREEVARMLENSPYRQEWRRWLTVDPGNLGGQGNNAVLADLRRDEITAFTTFAEGPDRRQELPPHLQFALGRFADEEDHLSVYALKFDQDNRIALSSRSIQEARVQTNESSGDVSIYLTLHEEGAQKWAEITRKNINRSIAVVIDDLVYFAPKVMAEIQAGKMQITGHFNAQEAKTLAAILQGGELPVEFAVR